MKRLMSSDFYWLKMVALMKNQFLILASLFLLTSMFANALVTADCKLILVSPSGTVVEGKDSMVEVHVFDKDAPADPQVITANDGDGNKIPLTKKTKGIYSATVKTSTDPYWSGNVDATATLGGVTGSSSLYLNTKTIDTTPKKRITMVAKDPSLLEPPITGKTLTFVIRTYLNNKPADDDTLETSLWMQTEQDELTPTPKHISTGVYEMSVSIPNTVHSGLYEVNAAVTQADDKWIDANINLYVDFYQVWMHKVSISKTSAKYEMYVSDLTGKTVTGGTLDLNYSYEDTHSDSHEDIPLVSIPIDSKGKATVTMDYTDPSFGVGFYGYVHALGKTQEFEGDFIVVPPDTNVNTGPRPPSNRGLDVVYQSNEILPVVKPSKTANLKFQAWRSDLSSYNFTYFANSPVYYYVYNYAKILSYGKVTTDAKGMLTLTVDVPGISLDDPNLYIDFRAEISSGTFWGSKSRFRISEYPIFPMGYTDYLTNLREPNLFISVDKLVLGGRTNVKTTPKQVTENTLGELAVFQGKIDMVNQNPLTPIQPDWWPTELHGGEGNFMSISGSSMVGHFNLPEFLPTGTYTIAVFVIVPEELSDYTLAGIHWNYIYVDVGSGGTTGSKPTTTTTLGGLNGYLFPLVVTIVVIVVVVSSVLVFMKIRKAKRLGAATVQPQPVQPVQYQPQQTDQQTPLGYPPQAAPVYDQYQPSGLPQQYTPVDPNYQQYPTQPAEQYDPNSGYQPPPQQPVNQPPRQYQ